MLLGGLSVFRLVVALGLAGGLGVRIDQLLRDWGRRRDVRALHLETVLIGHIAQRDRDTMGIGVRVRTVGDLHLMVLAARVLHEAFLLRGNTVARLVRKLVATVVAAVRFAVHDRDLLSRGVVVLRRMMVLVGGGQACHQQHSQRGGNEL